MDKTIILSVKANIDAFKKGMNDVKRNTEETKKSIQSSNIKLFDGSFDKARNELSDFQNRLNNTKTAARNAGSNLKMEFAKVGIAIYGVSKILQMMGSSLTGAISRADTLHNFSTQMGNMGIEADKSQQAINYISKKLEGLPTTLDSAVMSMQRFSSVNGDITKSTLIFEALNNAILAGGAKMDLQKTALEQLTQSYAKGKPDIVEWRSAMMAMPAQLNQLALAFKLASPQELYSELSSGKITMDAFMQKIVELNKKGVGAFASFEQQARGSSAGISTSLSNLKTAFARGTASIIESFDYTVIVKAIQLIKQGIDNFYKAITFVLIPIKILIQAYKEMGEIGKFITKVLIGVIVIAPVLSSAFMLIKFMADKLSLAYIRLATSSTITSFVMSKGFMTAAGVIILGLVVVTRAFGGFTNFINNFGKAVVATMQYVAGSIVLAFASIIRIIGSLFGQNWGQQLAKVGNSMIASARKTAAQIKGSGSGEKQGSGEKKSTLAKTQESLGKSTDIAKKGMDRATKANKANAKSADKANKANKALKDNLMGFDEIHKITDESSNAADMTPKGSIGGGGGGAPSMDIDSPQMDTSGLKDATKGFKDFKKNLEKMKNKIQQAMPIIVAFLAIFAIARLIKFVKGLKDVSTTLGILKSVFTGFSAGKLLAVLGGVALAFSGVVITIKGLMEMINNPSWQAFATLLAGIAAIAGGVALAFGIVPGIIAGVVAAVIVAVTLIVTHWEEIKTFFAELWERIKNKAIEVWNTIVNWIIGVKDKVVAKWDALKQFFATLWEKIKNKAIEIWEKIKNKIEKAKEKAVAIWDAIVGFFSGIWERIKNKAIEIWNSIVGKVQGAKERVIGIWSTVTGFFGGIGSRIGNTFNTVKNTIGGAFSSAWERVKSIFSGVGGFFGKIRDKIKSIFGEIGGKISSSVSGSFKGAINGVTGGAVRVVNKLIGGFNGALGFINKVPGVHIRPARYLSVPRMATGGVVNARQGGIPAIIGEGRYDEAVVPLGSSPQMTEMKNDIANAVINSMGSNNGLPEKLTIDLTAGGGEMRLGKYIVDLTRKAEAIL